MERRRFLQLSAGAAISAAAAHWSNAIRGEDATATAELSELSVPPPAFSVTPVVGDGKWIWNAPPEGQTGYLEPRPFEATIEIQIEGRGDGAQIKATTPVPVPCPEQKIEDEKVETDGCEAEIREVGPFARQLVLAAPAIAPGQTISARLRQRLTISKQYLGFERGQFPLKQTIPAEIRRDYLGNSPGIDSRAAEVRQLLAKLRSEGDHPWDLAKKFAEWIPENIKPYIGPYAGVSNALQARRGDCAEMSAVFVALCRAAEIPARLVWVPNHNWAEFCLIDKEGKEQWIPVHTACYFWFGWTGVHELVLQKGDRIHVPERQKTYRLLEDWVRWGGRKPEARYLADIRPLAMEAGADPGPGARRKDATGEWKLVGTHPLDKAMRR
jgi:hypothetical protein